jgi:predicted TIM-barrel fold metal-dependent hydrolase
MSEILQNWQNGRGFPGVLVIDGHIHVGEWPHNTTFRSLDEAEEQSIRTMDANGVDAICAVSGGYIFGKSDYHLGNDFLLALWKRMPERLIPFMSLNPNDTRAEVLAELERMHAAGVRCIKLINAYQGNYPGDGPNLMALYEFAAQHRMLVFDHAWSKAEITRIAMSFPTVDFIFGHYTGGYQDEVMLRFANVYTNIWNYGNLGWLDRGLKKVGAHKFMMGSDGFLNALSVGSGPVAFAPISDEEKRLVLGLNIARLVDKVGALPAGIKAVMSDG